MILIYFLFQTAILPAESMVHIELLQDDEFVNRSASLTTKVGKKIPITNIKDYNQKTKTLELENHFGEKVSIAVTEIKTLRFTQSKNSAPTLGQVSSSTAPAYLQEDSYLRTQAPLDKLNIQNNRLSFSYQGSVPKGYTAEVVEITFTQKSAMIVWKIVQYEKKNHKEHSSGSTKGIR